MGKLPLLMAVMTEIILWALNAIKHVVSFILVQTVLTLFHPLFLCI